MDFVGSDHNEVQSNIASFLQHHILFDFLEKSYGQSPDMLDGILDKYKLKIAKTARTDTTVKYVVFFIAPVAPCCS